MRNGSGIGTGQRDRMSRRAAILVAAVFAALAAALAGMDTSASAQSGSSASASASSSASASAAASSGEARNVILVVGDGLGPAQRDAIQLATVGPYESLAMDGLPYEGMVGTNSVESDDPPTFVTDSAAAATSMASGVKTYNGAVGLDADNNVVPTVLEQARAAGKSTGIVTTSQVTDATGAAFGAHVEDRDEQTEIARQYIEESRPDVILGGGEDYWYPEGDEGAYPDKTDEEDEEVSASDQGNLVEQAQQAGYEYASDADELAATGGPKILGLFANEEMFQQFPEGEGDEYDPVVPLPQMTEKALDTLSQNPEGFFLVVEEEAIDEMGHANNSRLMIEAGQEMDRSVALLEDYAESSGDTLLITTADHEVGGLTVEATDDPEYPDESGGNEGDENANISTEDGPFPVADTDYEFVMDWTTTGHTAVDVPLTAKGPGAEQLTGNYENTHVYDVMAESLGVAGLEPQTGSASASATASSASAVPDTGGPGISRWAVGVAATVAVAAALVVGRIVRGASGFRTP